MTARLTFTATVQGVKVNVAKGDYDYGGAYADITFRVSSPKKPRRPMTSYRYGEATSTVRRLTKASGKLSDKEAKQLAAARNELADEKARFDAQNADYARELQNIGPQLMAYAQIAGLVAVFGGQPVTLTLEPQAQDLLPGLDVMMLPAPEHGDAGDLTELDDEDEDLEDEDPDAGEVVDA